MQPEPLTPEQLVAKLQQGESISSEEVISVSPLLEPQTDIPLGDLPTESVKDGEVISSSPPVINLIKGAARSKAECETTSIKTSMKQVALSGRGIREDKPVEALEFDGIDIKDPVELLHLLDENILSGMTKLHDWQIQFMVDFADGRHTKESPFQAVVQACNSSGKDKYIIAACAVWLCMRYREVECPITSSSGNQLDNQTGAHIDRLCGKVNALFGAKLWKINYRYFEFQHKGDMGEESPSKLKLFATDEAGKAEGYHPIEAGKKMAIFTSETKSIPSDITDALERCTGFTHRVDASSPGLPAGYFYNTCMRAIDRSEIEDIKELSSEQVVRYKVTAYQCSHITESEIARIASKLAGGRENVVFKSSVLAEFGSTDEMVVIPSSYVEKACSPNFNSKIVWLQEDFNTAGLDLSDGGAETVLVVRNGNKMIGMEAFKFEDSEDTIEYLQEKFKFWKLNHAESLIFGDYCGLGGPMLRSLKRKKWHNVRFVDSRNKAAEPKTYLNRGTELFFSVRKLMEGKELILMNDQQLKDQLSTRYYKLTNKLIHQLLSKLEQKAKGYLSPDRADALNLAFWNYKSTRTEETDSEPLVQKEEKIEEKITGDFDLIDWSKRTLKKDPVQHDVPKLERDYLREEIAQYNQQRNKLVNK